MANARGAVERQPPRGALEATAGGFSARACGWAREPPKCSPALSVTASSQVAASSSRKAKTVPHDM